MTFEFNYVLL